MNRGWFALREGVRVWHAAYVAAGLACAAIFDWWGASAVSGWLSRHGLPIMTGMLAIQLRALPVFLVLAADALKLRHGMVGRVRPLCEQQARRIVPKALRATGFLAGLTIGAALSREPYAAIVMAIGAAYVFSIGELAANAAWYPASQWSRALAPAWCMVTCTPFAMKPEVGAVAAFLVHGLC